MVFMWRLLVINTDASFDAIFPPPTFFSSSSFLFPYYSSVSWRFKNLSHDNMSSFTTNYYLHLEYTEIYKY